MFDYLIIGGGAAGLCSALAAAKLAPQKSIAVIEQADRVGKKIAVTGNGRCNITNRHITPERYHSQNMPAVSQILSAVSSADTAQFFAGIGIPFCFEENKGYPASLQASSVTDALRFAAAATNITLILNTAVTSLAPKNGLFVLQAKENETVHQFRTKAVLVATGGLAGGHKLGSTGSGYGLLKNLGHRITPCSPAIVQVKTQNSLTRQLKGIKLFCQVTALQKNKPVATEQGELLFCDYGLSGPPVLQLSRYVTEQKGTALLLDLFPSTSLTELTDQFFARRKLLSYRPTEEFFTGLLHKKVGRVLLQSCGVSPGQPCKSISAEALKNVALLCKQLPFAVQGSTGYPNAQVTHGGASLSEFSSKTLMSKNVPGLFAAGEVLDCDGDCGGFNLEWAWRTGLLTARNAVQYLEKQHAKV